MHVSMWGLKLLFNLYLYSVHYCNLIIYVYTLRYTIYKLYFGRRTCPCSISFLMQCILPLLMVFRYNLLSRNIPSPRHSLESPGTPSLVNFHRRTPLEHLPTVFTNLQMSGDSQRPFRDYFGDYFGEYLQQYLRETFWNLREVSWNL